ncbi:MAG: hypothetical protein IJS68_00165, partial [Clostridia bacterium]|nr:hypothetical protein [Clostridia bacterium]
MAMGLKVGSLFANGEGAMADLANESAALGGLFNWLFGVFEWILEHLVWLLYFIIKFALNIVDFVHYFIQRLIGIDFWNNPSANLTDLTESDILFKFLLSDVVINVFKYMLVIGLLLLILFSIVAIVKADYAGASNEGGMKRKPDGSTGGPYNNKKGILVKALKAIALVILVPLMTIFGLLASNAVLASILNAIQPENNTLTLGGQIFVASAYSASRYRNYVDEGQRYVASYDYTFAYNAYEYRDDVNGRTYYYYVPVDGTGTIYEVYNDDTNTFVDSASSAFFSTATADTDATDSIHRYFMSGSNFRVYKLADYETDKSSYYLDEAAEATFENGVTKERIAELYSGTQFFSCNANFDPINPQDYDINEEKLHAFIYKYKKNSGAANTDALYLASFTSDIDKLAKYHILTKVRDDVDVLTSNLGIYQASSALDLFSTGLFGLIDTIDGLITAIGKLADSSEQDLWSSSAIRLGACWQANPVVQAAYNTWTALKIFENYHMDFESSVRKTATTWYAESGKVINGSVFTNNSETWGYFDGGSSCGFTPITPEYEVMADLYDFAIKNYVKIYVVNSQNAKIDWSGVNQNCYKQHSETTGLIELCVNYKDEGYVVYKPTNSTSEEHGAVYLMCLYNTQTGLYDPIIPGNLINNDGVVARFKSSAYSYSQEQDSGNEGLVIARGIFDGSNQAPTFISELLYDTNGKQLTSTAPVYFKAAQSSQNGITTTRDHTLAVTYGGIVTPPDTDSATGIITYNDLPDDFTFDATSLSIRVDGGDPISPALTPMVGANKTRYSFTQGGRTYYFDVFVDTTNHKMTIAPYHMYSYTAEETLHSFSGINFDYVGATRGGTPTLYCTNSADESRRLIAVSGSYELPDSTNYYYIANSTTSSTTNKLVGSAYNAYSYIDKEVADTPVLNFANIAVAMRNSGLQYVDLFNGTGPYTLNSPKIDPSDSSKGTYTLTATALTSFSVNYADNNIYDNNNNLVTGVVLSGYNSLTQNGSIAFYENGINSAIISFHVDKTDSINWSDDSDLINKIIASLDEESEAVHITSLYADKTTYQTLPSFSHELSSKLSENLQPIAIYFNRDSIGMQVVSADLSMLDAIRVHIRLFGSSIRHISSHNVFNYSDGSFILDYNFDTRTGVKMQNIFQASRLNLIVLVAATILVFKILMQSMWGLIKRIYMITILMMIMPGVAGLMPLDDGKKFGSWVSELVKNIFSAYGVLIALNLYFVLVPVIDSATANLFSTNLADYPSTIRNSILLRRPELLNVLAALLFNLVALTLLQTLPGFIAGLVGGGEVYKEGGDVKKDVDSIVKDTANT